MANFVGYDGEQLLVVHEVHDAGIYPYGAVCAGKGVDFVVLVYLVVERNVSHLGEPLGQVAEALGVCVGFREHGTLGIQLSDVLLDVCDNIRFREREGLGGV